MQFKSKIFILPGLGNSGEGHWQTHWQNQFNFQRIEQANWETPVREDWIAIIDDEVSEINPKEVILVGHSLACNTIVAWADKSKHIIKGALLVSPSDTEADSYPSGTNGFRPMPLNRVPFPTIVIASSNDPYVTISRAEFFAREWGSEYNCIGNAGHINVASGQGVWNDGLEFLKQLDSK